MIKARKKAIPSSPNTFEEAVAGFEANQFPDLYQDMFLGHAKHQFEGEMKSWWYETMISIFRLHFEQHINLT